LIFEFNKKTQSLILSIVFILLLLTRVYIVILITILLVAFIVIVLGNKKYAKLNEKIEDFLL